MNAIQRILFERLRNGDPRLRVLFEEYVITMGHSPKQARNIVESVLTDGQILQESTLADMARYERKDP